MSLQRLTQLFEREEANRAYAGELFGIHFEDLDLDISETVTLLIKTGASRVFAFRQLNTLGGAVSIVIYKGPTITNDGTEITAYNKYTGGIVTPLVKFYYSPTVTKDGTQCYESGRTLGSTTNQSKAGGSISGNVPRILEANTNYYIKINTNTANTMITYDIDFYES
jgi:hypothetical protein